MTETTQPDNLLSAKALRTREPPISYLMAVALERPDLVSLAAGFVDNETLPVEAFRQTAEEIFADPEAARAALQYGTTLGYPPLRQELLDRLLRREGATAEALGLTADDVIITSGSQQLLYLISSVLVDPGSVVLLPRPAYFVYMGVLEVFGADAVGIDVDGEGLRADHLDQRLGELDAAGRLDRVKLLYVCSYFDNPTGLTLTERRRREIVDVVRRWRRRQRFFILEDAAYRDLVGPGVRDLPSMKTLDPDNDLVALVGTFSKPLAPGLKTGYGYLPSALLRPVLHQKGSHDFGSSNLCQHLIHRLLVSGRVDEHIATLRQTYAAKRQAMLEALEQEFARLAADGRVTWTRPDGGLYVWLTLPETANTDLGGPLFQKCLEQGVLYVPGRVCHCGQGHCEAPAHHMRLSFGVPDEATIREGVRRLARAVEEDLV